ncbi:homoserine dehydrogenase [Desulfurobacterium sp.]
MDSVKVGVVGCGTVGSGVVKILLENGRLIKERTGKEIELTLVADRNVERVRKLGVPEELIVDDGFAVVESDVDIVVELVGGTTVAKDIVRKALENGKHVVSANKALFASFGEELFSIAAKNGVSIRFEASVGGGIPVVKALNEGLIANKVEKILGIINGTANFILTEMTERGISFEEALEVAKEMGYAEANPSLDVDGIDAAHKIAILASIAYGGWITIDDVYVKGIREITPLDVDFAHEFGYKIKLLAVAKPDDGKVEVRVHPAMLPEGHILSSVDGVFNACLIEGDFVGPTLYYGMGAGQKPTASAVVADVADIACGRGSSVPVSLLGRGARIPVKRPGEFVSSFYLRFTAVDKPGVLAKISSILGKFNISIKMALQKSIEFNGGVPVVMTTHEAAFETVKEAIAEIDELDVIVKPTFLCMIEE